MRTRLLLALAALALAASPALAEPPAGFETIYAGPTTVNLAGRPVVADLAFHKDPKRAARRDLRLALTTDVTSFIEQTEQDLENWVATKQERCGQRWAAGEPLIAFPEGAIRFALDLELEVWNCGWNGAGEPGRLTREAGGIDVTLIPYVEAGKLQARIGALAVEKTSGVSKYLPLEFVLRQVLDNEIKKLNQNRKFYRAPEPLNGEGFVYESIRAEETAEGRVVITAMYRASGDANAFDRLAAKLRAEGLTQ